MTADEAINQFKERLEIPDYKTQIPEYYEAMELAIKVFEEIQQYRELGTVEEIADCIKQSEEEFNMLIEYLHIGTIEEFKELKEKNVAKKPNRIISVFGHPYECVYCGNELEVDSFNGQYCHWCGQKLDWKEVAE